MSEKEQREDKEPELDTDSCCDDERFFGNGRDGQNNIHLSYYENFLHNRRVG